MKKVMILFILWVSVLNIYGQNEKDKFKGKFGNRRQSADVEINGLEDRNIIVKPQTDLVRVLIVVALDVCIDKYGKVVSVKFDSISSTTNEPNLIRSAVDAARETRFTPKNIEKECGTLSYEFKVN